MKTDNAADRGFDVLIGPSARQARKRDTKGRRFPPFPSLETSQIALADIAVVSLSARLISTWVWHLHYDAAKQRRPLLLQRLDVDL